VNPNDPSIAQCRKDVIEATDASHTFYTQLGYYAPDLKTLVEGHFMTKVPADVSYGYLQADIEPTILGKVAGC
jgi:hypothetical protein